MHLYCDTVNLSYMEDSRRDWKVLSLLGVTMLRYKERQWPRVESGEV